MKKNCLSILLKRGWICGSIICLAAVSYTHLIYEKSRLPEEYTRAFFRSYDVMSVIDKEVMELYNKHFLRVSQMCIRDSSTGWQAGHRCRA